MGKWFTEVKTVEELRKKYRQLLRKYHPDNPNGSTEVTKQINAEYDALYAEFSKVKSEDEQSTTQEEKEENEAFKEVLNSIIHINADVEIIGKWVWVHGAYAYKDLLKNLGFRYAPRKKSWCWHFGEYSRRSKRDISLDEVRLKYGSRTVNHKSKQYALN